MREMRIFLEHLESAQWAENWETDAGKKSKSGPKIYHEHFL